MGLNEKTKSKHCLGIDPGVAHTGWAVIARHRSGRFVSLSAGVIHTEAYACDAVRYATIYNAVNAVIGEHTPDLLSIEKVDFNKNVSSCLSPESVIGAILLTSHLAGIPESIQVTPQQVTASVTGRGRASKVEVKQKVSKLLGVEIQNGPACDAAAAAIAGLLHKS